MYFWNTKALAHELSSNTLDKKHYKNYDLIDGTGTCLALKQFNF